MFKKKRAPRDLPDLAIEELKKDLKEAFSDDLGEEKLEDKKESKPEEKSSNSGRENNSEEESKISEDEKESEEEESNEEEKDSDAENPSEEEKSEKEDNSEDGENSQNKSEDEKNFKVKEERTIETDEKGFFKQMMEDLESENSDDNSMYTQVFSKKDLVEEMKNHWQGKKDEILIKHVGKEYKEKINAKAKKLQELESQWQEIYFKLIQKEEDMRNEESELKEVIQEFIKKFKKRGNIKNFPKYKEE